MPGFGPRPGPILSIVARVTIGRLPGEPAFSSGLSATFLRSAS